MNNFIAKISLKKKNIYLSSDIKELLIILLLKIVQSVLIIYLFYIYFIFLFIPIISFIWLIPLECSYLLTTYGDIPVSENLKYDYSIMETSISSSSDSSGESGVKQIGGVESSSNKGKSPVRNVDFEDKKVATSSTREKISSTKGKSPVRNVDFEDKKVATSSTEDQLKKKKFEKYEKDIRNFDIFEDEKAFMTKDENGRIKYHQIVHTNNIQSHNRVLSISPHNKMLSISETLESGNPTEKNKEIESWIDNVELNTRNSNASETDIDKKDTLKDKIKNKFKKKK